VRLRLSFCTESGFPLGPKYLRTIALPQLYQELL
jgi:hypothetical protein